MTIRKQKRWKVAVVTDPQWGFGRDVVEGCIRYLEERNSGLEPVLICEGFEDPDRLSRQFDAFMLSGRSPWIRPYISVQPVVYLDLGKPAAGELSISTDTETIGELAVDMLWNRGIASFGYCDFPPQPGMDIGPRSEARLNGFIQGLEERGIRHAQKKVQRHTLTGSEELLNWIESLPRQTGIFAFNDAAALEVLQACALLGLQVPHEIAVVGVDNDELVCQMANPSISTIDVDLPGLAYQGLATLEQILEGNAPVEMRSIIPVKKKVLRESTGHFSARVDDRLLRAVQYISEHAHEGASVTDVVRVAGLSHRSLEILFKEQRGRTPQEELIAARHRYCRKELRVNRASIEEISAQLDMSHSSFYRTFKKLEGCTPAAYRNYFRGGLAPVRKLSRKNPEMIRIGMLSSFQWQASRDFIEGVTAYAQTDPGIHLIPHDYERMASLAKQVWYDGALVVSGDKFPENANLKTPAVYHAYEQNQSDAGQILVDETDVGLLAGRHFIRKGHCNFAYCAYFDVKFVTQREKELGLSDRRSRDRQNGFRTALDNAGMHDTPIHAYIMDEAAEPLLEWIRRLPKPVALFCFNDQVAIQIQMMCQNHDIKVPEEIAILGVDNSPGYCRLARPSLSSIDIGFSRIGAHTLKQFVAYLRNEQPPQRHVFPAQMVHARGSTAGIAVDDQQLQSAVKFIETRFNESITVDDIARAAGLSRRLLEMRFKKQLHSTPRSFLQETRLLHAEKRLIYSSLHINEISDECGFRQTSYFCRVFRENLGLTPSQFRAQRGALKYHPLKRNRA